MKSCSDHWLPTREYGLRRLREFVPRAGRDYARLRNFDDGPGRHSHVSSLSPWIRHRLVLEEEVISAVLRQHSLEQAEKFVQEVCWRTYWKGWLELRPGVWEQYRARVSRMAGTLSDDAGLRGRWDAATGGETGIECFDAWAGELVDTGYLHNHARMWFASIWIFTLGLPWELGADYFLRHLLDGDPASNTLSWRWVAGLQTPGKTYLARPGNISRYTQDRFRPGSELAIQAPPLRGPAPPAPADPPVSDVPDHALPTGLLITEEDLHPDYLLEDGVKFVDCAVLQTTAGRSPLPVSARVLDFVDGALDDARSRIGRRLGRSASPVQILRTASDALDWARSLGLRQVVTAYPPTGPTAEAVSDMQSLFSTHGIRLVQILREWDKAAWPHATHGFFRFRRHIPRIIETVRANKRPSASGWDHPAVVGATGQKHQRL